MAIKKEKLAEETVTKLVNLQAKLNDCALNLGEIHLRNRDIAKELKRLEESKELIETQFDETSKEISSELKELEKQYPKGEIDLKEGVVMFESAE
jgi:protein subunit release factor A